MNTNVDLGLYILNASKRLRVPLALTSKSTNGSFAAQSCDGCAAVWIIDFIFPLYFLKILKSAFLFLISI